MLFLGGFELYSRWVALTTDTTMSTMKLKRSL